jgi:hypothetical protein
MTFTRPTLRALTAVTTLTVAALSATVAPGDAATATAGSTYGPARHGGASPALLATTMTARTSTAALVRKTDLSQMSPPIPDSAGIVYMSDVDRLLISDSEVDEMPIYQGVNLWQVSRTGTTLFDTGNTREYSREASGVGYDPVGKRVFVSDDDKDVVFEVTAGADARLGTVDDPVTSFSTLAFGDDDAEDVAYDTVSGDLFVTQGGAQEVWRVSRGANGRFDGVAPTGDDGVSHFDVAGFGALDVEGIAYSPVRDTLFLADRRAKQIIEVSKAGELIQSIDVTAIGMRQPAGITLAPASDNPARTSMYVVTRARDNNSHPDEADGAMYELSAPDLGPITQVPNKGPSVSAGPDRTVKMPTSAVLDGTVSDDGKPKPPGATTVTWTKVSGPGNVVFAHPKDVDTTASFDAAGTYVLRLTATDSALTVKDEMTVDVTGGDPMPSVVKCQGAPARVQIGPSSDDRLSGTKAVDLLRGERGNDVLIGRGDSDCLSGGPGKDTVRGNGGVDVLTGNGGQDLLLGGGQADRLNPGGGKDVADSGSGDDRINTVDGKRDRVLCGSGTDRVVADKVDKVADSCERVVVKSKRT